LGFTPVALNQAARRRGFDAQMPSQEAFARARVLLEERFGLLVEKLIHLPIRASQKGTLVKIYAKIFRSG